MTKYHHCFIVTYGKSGSTLLQGILNAVPGYLIRGENLGMVNGMRNIVKVADKAKRNYSRIGRTPSTAWYGIGEIDRDSLIRSLGDVFIREVLRPEPDTTCIGFKEIRYGPDDVGNLEALLTFMSEMFADSCFIFNSRNLAETSRRGMWTRRPDSLTYLKAFESRMQAAHGSGAWPSHWVDYDAYVHDPNELKPLFEFLGEDFDSQRVTEVMSARHGPYAT
jgi:hypothetical protein